MLIVATQASITFFVWHTMEIVPHHTSALSSYIRNWCIELFVQYTSFNIGSFSRTTFEWLWIYVANAAMEGLNKALKICQQSCTIYRKLRFVRTKSALFMRSLPHLWKEHSNSRFPICSKAVLQTHVRKVFWMSASVFKTRSVPSSSPLYSPSPPPPPPSVDLPPTTSPTLTG